MDMIREIQPEYAKLAQSYNDGIKFLPKAAKIEFFWRLYPNGAIITPLPTKDITGEGIFASCQIYSDRADREHSLIADVYSRRASITQEDLSENTIDIYAAAQADAVSRALAMAGVNISAEEIYKDVTDPNPEPPRSAPAPASEEFVREDGNLVEDSIPAPEAAENSAEKPAAADKSESKPSNEAPKTIGAPEEQTKEPAPELPKDDDKESKVLGTKSAESEEIDESDIPDIQNGDPETDPAAVSEKKPKSEHSKSKSVEKASKVEKRSTSKLVEKAKPVETVKASEKSEIPVETEESLIQETGVSYEEALTVEFRHQTRSGVLGDLLAAETDRLLLKWMGKPNSGFRRSQPNKSKIAQIIVLHNNIV